MTYAFSGSKQPQTKAGPYVSKGDLDNKVFM